jgi:hypothetical protein
MCGYHRASCNDRFVIEFDGPLDRDSLRLELDGRDVDPDSYYLDGGHPPESYVLEDRRGEWVVYYSERGLESGLRSFASEDLASRHLAHLLLADPTTRKL